MDTEKIRKEKINLKKVKWVKEKPMTIKRKKKDING
jgi:hypothetical protein